MDAKKLKVGSRVQWKSYGTIYTGTVEKILKPGEGSDRPVKVRPDPAFPGGKENLTSFKKENITVI